MKADDMRGWKKYVDVVKFVYPLCVCTYKSLIANIISKQIEIYVY